MKKTLILSLAIMLSCLAMAQSASSYTQQYNWPWRWNGNTIVTKTPKRALGQQHALQLTAPKMDTVRIAFVGLGMRGADAVGRYMHIDGIRVVALCDYEAERTEQCQQILKSYNRPLAALYNGEDGYRQMCERDDIDLVYVATDWHHHFLVAECALRHGKHVAIEVPSAMTLYECWTLVDLVEKNRLHCMILENCCYDQFELNTLNMAQQGVFGTVVRVQGAYIHTLDEYWMAYWKNGADDRLGWRLRYNKDYRGDLYPTHGLGPVAQLLDIHRGDRMETLVAMDTRSFRGAQLAEKYAGEPCSDFQNGDHTTTLIRTANGKVIEIQHNVMTPQPYNRLYQLTGTEGFANKYPFPGYAIDGKNATHKLGEKYDNLSGHSYMNDQQRAALEEQYQSPILKEQMAKAKQVGGHGGMDYIMDARLIYCLRNGLPLDMDVYDLAEWCCLAELGYLSVTHGFAPVAVPDFTRGHWRDIKGYRHAF